MPVSNVGKLHLGQRGGSVQGGSLTELGIEVHMGLGHDASFKRYPALLRVPFANDPLAVRRNDRMRARRERGLRDGLLAC